MVLFSLEMLLKMVVMNVWSGKHAYLRSTWNVLDFVIVVVSWVSLIFPGIVVLRVLRAARPVRLFSRQGDLTVSRNSARDNTKKT